MNIFILSMDSQKAAEFQCDAHVVKMILESAQILCNCFPENYFPLQYKRTHYNHPCSIWARESVSNYVWLKWHAYSLCREYTKRYGKIHKSQNVLQNLPSFYTEQLSLTPFALAMPEEFHRCNPEKPGEIDAVESYRAYYRNKAKTLPRFTYTNAIPPEWLP